MILSLQLALCLGVTGIAGWHLSRNGDIIAEKTGLSASWISFGLFALYLINTWILFTHGH